MTEPPVRVSLAAVSDEKAGVLTLRFDGRGSVDAVEVWRGCALAIEASERVPLTGDRFYYDELKGMSVTTESGVSVGVVRDLWPAGPHDLLVIDDDGVERLLPMVRDFVLSVDRAASRVTVRPPNGWLDDAAV